MLLIKIRLGETRVNIPKKLFPTQVFPITVPCVDFEQPLMPWWNQDTSVFLDV